VRFAFALCLAVALLAPVISAGADRKESGGPWIATAAIIRNGEHPGSGAYLKSGLILTAAHLTAIEIVSGGLVVPLFFAFAVLTRLTQAKRSRFSGD
jgi:hypothetical protein